MVTRRTGYLAGLFLAGAISLLALPSAGQEASAPEGPIAKVDVMEQFSFEAGIGDEELYLRSLEAALLSEPLVGGLYRSGSSETARAKEIARNSGCRLLLELKLARSPGSTLSATWTFTDTGSNASVKGSGFRKPIPDTAVLSSSFWSELIVDLESAIAEPRPDIILEVLAPPGTRFDGAGGQHIVPKSGKLLIGFKVPLVVAWTARIPGRYPTHGAVEVGASGTTTLKIRSGDWSLGVGAIGLTFPEIFADMALGNYLSLRGGLSQYLFGLHLGDANDGQTGGSPPYYVSLPLVAPFVGIAASPFPVSSNFRPFAAMDLFARVGFVSLTEPLLDPVAPWGVGLSIGLDWGIGRSVRFWSEVGANLYPWADFSTFVASVPNGGGGAAIFGGRSLFAGHPGWAGEFPIGAAGIRIGL